MQMTEGLLDTRLLSCKHYFSSMKYGTVSSKITLVILFQNFQDQQKKVWPIINSVPNNFMMDSPI